MRHNTISKWQVPFIIIAIVLIITGVCLTQLMSIPFIQKLATLNDIIDILDKLLKIISTLISGIAIIKIIHKKEVVSEVIYKHFNFPFNKIFYVSIILSSFLLLLCIIWFINTKERIIPNTTITSNRIIIDTQKAKIINPISNNVLGIGYVKVQWKPNGTKVLQVYRNSSLILESSQKVLTDSKMYLNKPGKIEIKIWNSEGLLDDNVWIEIVGNSFRPNIIYLAVAILFFIIFLIIYNHFSKKILIKNGG